MRSGQESDELARECFSALQLIEANPLIWAAQGSVFERRPTGFDKSSHDAYVAALEVAKPCDALLGSALTWLKMHATTLAKNAGILHSVMDPVHALRTQVRHEVEGPLLRFLNRRPIQPLAWLLLAWCLEIRGALSHAHTAICTGVRALNITAAARADNDTSLELESALMAFVRAFVRCKVKRNLQQTTDADPTAAPLLADCSHLETLIGKDKFKAISSTMSLVWNEDHVNTKHSDIDGDRQELLVRSWSLWIMSERNPTIAAASSSACLWHLSEAMNVALTLGSAASSTAEDDDASFVVDFVRTCGALSERITTKSSRAEATGFAPPAALLSTLATALIVLDDTDSTSQPVNVVEMCAARSTSFAMTLARSVLGADGKDGAIRLLRKFLSSWHPRSMEISVMLAELLMERAAESSGDLKEASSLLDNAHHEAWRALSGTNEDDRIDNTIINDKDDWPSGVASNLLCRITLLRLQVAQKRRVGIDEEKLSRDCKRSLHMFPSMHSFVSVASSMVV